MREIKFRGWNGEKMIYYDNWFTLDQGETLCFEKSNKHSYVDNSDVDFPNRVIPMQYTGLKDKNGKEIYEGDIIDVKQFFGDKEEFRDIVVWDDESLKRCLENTFRTFKGQNIEVIGNIYENPDLLPSN